MYLKGVPHKELNLGHLVIEANTLPLSYWTCPSHALSSVNEIKMSSLLQKNIDCALDYTS